MMVQKMEFKLAQNWLAFLLLCASIRHSIRRSRSEYVGSHRPEVIEERGVVERWYHPEAKSPCGIVDSAHRYAEMWLCRFDERVDTDAPIVALFRCGLESLTTVIEALWIEQLSGWNWLQYDTGEWPVQWLKEREFVNA